MTLQDYLYDKFKTWRPPAPELVDRTKGTVTLRWEQLEPFGFLVKDLLFKVEKYSKLPQWSVVYSGGKTTKRIENLAPRHPHRFRLKVILKTGAVPYLADRAIASLGNDSTIYEIFNKLDNRLETHQSQTVNCNVTKVSEGEKDSVLKDVIRKLEVNNTDYEKVPSADLISGYSATINNENEKQPWMESQWSAETWTSTDTDGTSAICFSMAVRCGYMKQVQGLLEERSDLISIINSTTGYTPLATAIRKGNMSMVKFLVCCGADIDQASSSGQTPLHLAVLSGHVPLAEYLLDKGADFQIRDWNGLRAEHYAVDSCSLAMVQFVLDRGGDVSVQDSNGWTPLFRAVCQGVRTEIIEVLVRRGSDVDVKDRAGLTLASVAKLLKNRAGHSRDSILRLVDTSYSHDKVLANFTRLTKKIHNANCLLKLT